jgi:23S rRNA (adenine-N6)-dimethyltransferase
VPADPGARWGWHQLGSDSARRLVADSGIRPGDLVIDIGAGTGALTAPLVAVGARVIAVELHPRRVEELRRRFATTDVTVVPVDAADLRLPRRPFHVVANPPFGITTAILRRLLSPGSRLVTANLVVPRHVALRWSEGRAPGAHRWAMTFEARHVARLPRSAFRPRPPGETSVLRIERRRSVGRRKEVGR